MPVVSVKTRLSDMQLELGLQTNVKRHSQTLHFNGRDVVDFLSSSDVIFTQLKTTEDKPLALLPMTHSDHELQTANIRHILRKAFHGSSRSLVLFLLFFSVFGLVLVVLLGLWSCSCRSSRSLVLFLLFFSVFGLVLVVLLGLWSSAVFSNVMV